MPLTDPVDQLAGAVLAGGLLAAVGLVNATAPGPRVRLAAVGAMAMAAALLAWARVPDFAPAISALAATLAAATGYAASPRLRGRLRTLTPGIPAWWGLAALGLVAILGGSYRYDLAEAEASEAEELNITLMATLPRPARPTGAAARTDAGAAIPLQRPAAERTAAELSRAEAAVRANLAAIGQAIPRGPASDASNCHGWVFADGRYSLHGAEVEAILADNHYSPRAEGEARPGDLVVYRNPTGTVAHTAVVRAVADDHTILVEGKWGWMGVYLHDVRHSCYGERYEFYHTDRGGHRLRGLPQSEEVQGNRDQG